MTETIKIRKTFKDYYEDPEYRQKHLEYIGQKIDCACGAIVSRSNMGHHRHSKKHQNWEWMIREPE